MNFMQEENPKNEFHNALHEALKELMQEENPKSEFHNALHEALKELM